MTLAPSSSRQRPAQRAAPRRPATRKPAARRAPPRRSHDQGPPSLTSAHVKGFIVGTLAGILIGASAVVYVTKEGVPEIAGNTIGAPTQDDPAPKARFDFYTLLPNQDLGLADDVEPANLTSSRQSNDLYVLQAGSFRDQADADRRRGELALLGLEATIERARGDNGQWFRVYLGPFESRSAMARARSITAQESIDTLLLKRPRTP